MLESGGGVNPTFCQINLKEHTVHLKLTFPISRKKKPNKATDPAISAKMVFMWRGGVGG